MTSMNLVNLFKYFIYIDCWSYDKTNLASRTLDDFFHRCGTGLDVLSHIYRDALSKKHKTKRDYD